MHATQYLTSQIKIYLGFVHIQYTGSSENSFMGTVLPVAKNTLHCVLSAT